MTLPPHIAGQKWDGLFPFQLLWRRWGLLTLGLTLLVITNALAQAVPWTIKRAIEAIQLDGEGARSSLRTLGGYCVAIALLSVGKVTARSFCRSQLFALGRAIEFELRNSLFTLLLQAPAKFFRRFRTGELMSRLTHDLAAVGNVMGNGPLFVGNMIVSYGIAIPLMLHIDPLLTSVVLITLPLPIITYRLLGTRIDSLARKVQDELGRLGGVLQEDFAGIGVIKSYALEQTRTAHFAQQSEHFLALSMKLARTRALLNPIMIALGGLSTVWVLAVGGWRYAQGAVSLGDIIAFNIWLGTLGAPAYSIGWMFSNWQRGKSGWGRVSELFAAGMEMSPKDTGTEPSSASALKGTIEARGLTIQAGEFPLLKDISFSISEGTVLGIAGPVGSGKSTLVEALLRLIDVPEGTLFIGGEDVARTDVQRVRGSIAYAPQDVFLFSASIRANIALGGMGNLEQSVAAAGLLPDLSQLPQGLDTEIGERGITLSGGQRQRVALARALMARTSILVLDDTLSAVDVQTERAVLDALREQMNDRTVILVSNRAAALQRVDRVILLEAGRIAEEGTHDELLRRNGAYARLLQHTGPSGQGAAA
ncbi:ABC transporter ATP-binding protein [Stigmatella sp. ncwal1]|uniref:ABC transporter ATP-binding protein n=1 Tax=Stigmatella ashevillensis TaxID=2995309 RepID=A0ABT5DHF6_9BACT|nr:ABC transporter ATP-binding protein [Stigmatella ashevillena]MDC0713095.1 ABC transporter ATP-binding protein [Stigmatella ashevillena]